jgi:methanogenic corrinoid protein MtbC1
MVLGMTNPYELIEHLAYQAIEEHRKERPEVFASYVGKGDHCIQDTKYHLTFLFDSVSIDSPQLFINYVAWAKVLLNHIGVTPIMFRENLEHIRRQCRQGLEGPFAKKVDQVIGQTLDEFQDMPETVPSFIDSNDDKGRIASKYLEQLLRGDRREAQATIRRAIAEGMGFKELYLSIFQPTQYEIGRQWQHRLISVAQEHYVTGVTQQMMSQIYPDIITQTGGKGVLIVTCVGNELHEMGARMVADFLEMDGWETNYLGSNTPTNALISIIKQRKAKGLFVSATMGYNVTKVRQLVEDVRSDPELQDVKIVVGGYPFNSVKGLVRSVGADGYARDAEEAIRVANDLLS